jgi:hypothetical protein
MTVTLYKRSNYSGDKYSLTKSSKDIERNSIDALKEIYVINDDDSVKEFLDKNIHLLEVLKEAHGKITDIFGNNIKELFLEHFIDPEEDFQCIYIKVITDLLVGDGLELIDKFYDKYWLNKNADIRRLVSVMV